MEAFGNAVLLGVQTGFQKTYTESLKKTLIPAYEKSSEEMFKQIQDVFLQGTKSCNILQTILFGSKSQTKKKNIHTIPDVKHIDAYISQYQPVHEEIIGLLNGMPETLKAISANSVTSCTTQIHNDIAKDLRTLQLNLTKSLRDNIKNEV